MDKEQAERLREQALAGEETEAALAVCARYFAQLRDERVRELEQEDSQLMALRMLEDKMTATIRSGQAALQELIK